MESPGVAVTAPPWSTADWAALVASGVRRPFARGEFLLRQGDPGTWVAAIVTGRVLVSYAGPRGEDIVLAVRGPRHLVGEFAQGDRGPRSASVTALEPCLAGLVPDARFTEWVHRHRLRAALTDYVLAKARESADLTWRLARGRPAERLAALLVTVVDAAPGGPAVVPMAQDELARAVGLARSSITPVLAGWKRRGWLQPERSRVVVRDVAALRAAM